MQRNEGASGKPGRQQEEECGKHCSSSARPISAISVSLESESVTQEGLNPAPHIHEQMTTSNYGYDIAYNFTHNNIMLEPNAMNKMNTVAHMDVHNTQY